MLVLDNDRDILDFDVFEPISLKMKAPIHGMVKERGRKRHLYV